MGYFEMNYADNYAFCNPYLVGDEYILWKGKPEKGNLFMQGDIVVMIFSIVWTSFAVFWELAALASGAPFFFALFGLPFIGVGLYLLVGRFIHTAVMREKTFYVVTNKKIMIKSGSRIKMYDGKDLPAMDVEIHKNGNGTISFTHEVYTRNGHSHRLYFRLENLPDVAQAQNAISMMER